MEVIFKLNMDDVQDRITHRRFVKSHDMAIVLFQILANLEKKVNQEVLSFEADSDPSDGVYAAFRNIRELCDSHGIKLEDLD